jgi:hypothetical protein
VCVCVCVCERERERERERRTCHADRPQAGARMAAMHTQGQASKYSAAAARGSDSCLASNKYVIEGSKGVLTKR